MTGFSAVLDTATLAASLDDAADALEDTDTVDTAAGRLVATAADTRIPRRTGRLRSSAAVSTDRDGARISWGVGYALPVHFGTRVMRARPFAFDALDAAAGAVETLWTDYLTETVARVRA